MKPVIKTYKTKQNGKPAVCAHIALTDRENNLTYLATFNGIGKNKLEAMRKLAEKLLIADGRGILQED